MAAGFIINKMPSFGGRVDFFGVADDRLIYDERKKRFVHTKDLPGFMTREYMNGSFKTVSSLVNRQMAADILFEHSRVLISLDKRKLTSRGDCASASN